MPASYAHYRFGRQVLSQLPGDVRQRIQRFRRMYDLGLLGPDFFFYYYPFLKTQVRDLGRTFHRQTGREFFTTACAAADTEAAQAYLYGLLGHYCLDAVCHPYIRQLEQIGEAKHVPLESEFERYLLVMDREPQPHTFDMRKRMKPTRGECMTIAGFYPGAGGGAVSQSFGSMAFHTGLLADPKREKIVKLFTRFYPSFPEHKIPAEENDSLAVYVKELHTLYEQAAADYPDMLRQLLQYMREGVQPGPEFDRAFG